MSKRLLILLTALILVISSLAFAGILKKEKPQVKAASQRVYVHKTVYKTVYEGVVHRYRTVDLGTKTYNIYRYYHYSPTLNGASTTVSQINNLLDDYGIYLAWHYNGDSIVDTRHYSGTKTWKVTTTSNESWVTTATSTQTINNGGLEITVVTTTYTTHNRTVKTQTTYKEHANVTYTQKDPLILDLDDNGKPDVPKGITAPHSFFDAKSAKLFDINADGVLDLVEWVGPNDGLLAIKTDKGINSAMELLSNAIGYANGFEKLSILVDENGDHWISGKELDKLVVWRDLNGDAIAQPNEVKPVSYYGIVKIYIVPDDNMSSFYITKDGKKHLIWEWWPSAFLSIGVRK